MSPATFRESTRDRVCVLLQLNIQSPFRYGSAVGTEVGDKTDEQGRVTNSPSELMVTEGGWASKQVMI